uniref:Retrovirus-related Pol polyprotein from transposon TNT 1-94 n=1 Tax=Tanacetum cinerariifolium TaxID=118510 RepID=A0A6L2NQX2_TANCI|nr:retrovirus-related Pol polyprotein from transposon TNT 1-94 [Tanacetum cinerariifolium]
MRIEQYFLMTDYSLWEVILNGDSSAPTRVVDGVLQSVAPTTAEQRLAKKNELKARGTLLMDFPDKHQLKFNSYKDAKTLMEAIEKSFKIYKAKVKSSSSTSTSTQNIAFVSSSNIYNTNEPVSAAASVFAISAKMPVFSLPNVDSLSNVVIYSFFASQSSSHQLDNDDLKQIDADDLDEMDLKWQMAMLTEGTFARECRSPKDSKRNGAAEPQRRNVLVETSTSNVLVSQCNGYHVVPPPYIGTFMPHKPDLVFNNAPNDVETNHPTFTVKLSPTKPDQDLSLTNRPSAPIIKDWVSDSEDESETKTTQNVPSFVQFTKQVKSPRPFIQHVKTSIPTATPKPANCDYHEKKMAQPAARNHAHRGNHKQYAPMTHQNSQKHMVPAAVLTQSKPVPITAVRPVSTAVPKISVTRPRHVNTIVTKTNSSTRRHINHSPSPKASNSPPRVTAAKALMVNAAQGLDEKWEWKPKCPVLDHVSYNISASMTLKRFDYNDVLRRSKSDKGVIDSGCSRHMIGNMSYISDLRSSMVDMLLLEVTQRVVHLGVFLGTKDETSPILKTFITGLENQLSLKVKVIKSDNKTEFKNHDLNQFCRIKGIKREFSVPRTPQQNGIAKRKNRTLIEATRTMLADSLLYIPFWAKAANTSCYVHNRVLVTKPHNKTRYKLLHGRTPSIGFIRPFGCPVTILNTLDSLGKFDWKIDEGFLVGYFVSSKAFRVFNNITQIIQETLHVNFLKNKPNVAGSGPTWLFDIDTLPKTMNYQPVTAGNQSNPSVGVQEQFHAKKAGEEIEQQYVLFPVLSFDSTNPHNTDGDAAFDEKEPEFDEKKPESEVNVSPSSSAQSKKQDNKTKREAKGKSLVESFIGYRNLSAEFEDFSDNSINEDNDAGTLVPTVGKISLNITYTFSVAGPSNAAASPTHGKSSCIDASQLPNDPDMPELEDITYSDDEDDVGAKADFNNLETSITVVLFQQQEFKVWVFVDLPYGKSAIGPNGFSRIKRIKEALWSGTKLDLSQQGHTQEEGIYYEEVFAPVEVVYACQPLGFEVPDHSDKDLCKSFEKLMKDKFQMSLMEELTFFLGLQIKQKKDGIFISHDKNIAEILKKFGLTEGKSASTPIDTDKPLLKDHDGEDVDVHTYRSMIGSLMYLTSSRPDIMFDVHT